MELVYTNPDVTGRRRQRDDNFGVYTYRLRSRFGEMLEMLRGSRNGSTFSFKVVEPKVSDRAY